MMLGSRLRVPTPHKDAMCRRCAGLVCRRGVIGPRYGRTLTNT